MELSVEIRDLRKSFFSRQETTVALDGVSFSVRKGEVFAFLGPNGSGKTTTLNILARLLLPDSGQVFLNGLAPGDPRYLDGVSFMSGDSEYLWSSSGKEILRFYAELCGRSMNDVESLAATFGMEGKLNQRWMEYSNGEKTRLRLVRALLKAPSLLFLDEPTVGLDPEAARSFRSALKEVHAKGTTIVLTSHYMQDVDELADTVCFIHRGRVESLRPKNDFTRLEDEIEIEYDSVPSGAEHLGRLEGDVLRTDKARVAEALGLGSIRSVRTVERDLEDYFVNLVRGGDEK